METTVTLPDVLFEESAALAASRGATVEQFIVQAVAKEVGACHFGATGDQHVELPIVTSKHPGTLDLSHFDFDDLLA
jgi:hypothetical protein